MSTILRAELFFVIITTFWVVVKAALFFDKNVNQSKPTFKQWIGLYVASLIVLNVVYLASGYWK